MFVWKSEVSLGSIDILKGSFQESQSSRSQGGLGNKDSTVYDWAAKSVSISQDEFSYLKLVLLFETRIIKDKRKFVQIIGRLEKRSWGGGKKCLTGKVKLV